MKHREDSPSGIEAAMLRVAMRETSIEHTSEFEPITRGPVFAVLALGMLGAVAACTLVWRKAMRLPRI